MPGRPDAHMLAHLFNLPISPVAQLPSYPVAQMASLPLPNAPSVPARVPSPVPEEQEQVTPAAALQEPWEAQYGAYFDPVEPSPAPLPVFSTYAPHPMPSYCDKCWQLLPPPYEPMDGPLTPRAVSNPTPAPEEGEQKLK